MTYERGYNFGAFRGDGKQGSLPARGMYVRPFHQPDV